MNELVSIIIPVYNVEQYISRCLESIVHQTVKNIEIIVIIDGSIDNSSNIIYEFAKNDKRIKVIDRENKGVLYSRIEGVLNSTGKYVMFVDGDDALEENAVEVMLKAISSEQSDIVKANYRKQKGQQIIPNKYYVTKPTTFSNKNYEPFIYDLLYKDIYFNSMCYCMFKKELFQNISFKYDLKYGEDLVTVLDLINQAKKITIIPDYVYLYTINEKGITLTKDLEKLKKKMADTEIVYNYLMNYVNIYSIKNKDYYYTLANTKLVFYLVRQFLELSSVSRNFKENLLYFKKQIKDVDIKNINWNYLKKYNIIYRISVKFINNDKLLHIISILYKYFK